MNEFLNNQPDPFDAVIEEFLGHCRGGRSPSAEEYAHRHPDLAERIRNLFPALLLLEGGPEKKGTVPLKKGDSPLFLLEGAAPTLPAESRFDSLTAGGTPAMLGPFHIVREVARGGMGVVYEAVQEPLGRRVALKVLPPECARRPSYRERFSREAGAAAKLHHTNIVPVFASGEHDGTLYFAMQFIDGCTVAELLAKLRAKGECPAGHFPWAARLALQAVEALACAHAHGILHRDIKPANLLVDGAGNLWVADFGLAKAGDADDLTGSGELVGTLRYLAPERFAGQSDTRSDVYALGATLYEMIALRPAFDETDRLRLVQQVVQGAPPLGQVAPGVPPDLETVVRKAMAADPADRYASAQDLANDLRLFLADQPVKARRASAWERLRRWARHNPGLARMTAAVAGLVLAVAVGASLLSWTLNVALGRTRAAERETQRKLLESLVAQARAVYRGRRSGQRFETLQLLDQAAELAHGLDLFEEQRAELRNVAIAALAMPDLYPVQILEDGFPPGSMHVDFDERLEVYARTDDRGNCNVRRVRDDVEIALLPRPASGGGETFPVLSRDGHFLAVKQAGGETRVWQLAGAPAQLVLEQEKVHSLEFYPNRPQVAFSYVDGRITLWDLPAGHLVASLRPNGIVAEPNIALHPTEPLVAVTAYGSNKLVQIRDLRNGEVVKSLELQRNGWWVAWHPAGHTLAASDGDSGTISLFDRATFRCRQTFAVHGGGPIMSYNRAGDRLAVCDWTGVRGLYEAATGRSLFVAHATGALWLPRFHADGRRLAGFIQDHRLVIFQVGEGREYRTLRLPGANAINLRAALSPDGRLVVAAMTGGVAFWDLDTGAELGFLPLDNTAGVVDFEPGPGGALLLGDESGLYRWPVRPDPNVPGRRRIGPPQALPFPAGKGFGRSADGRVFATCFPAVDWYEPWAGVWVRCADRPDRPLLLETGTDVLAIDVSPDGRWLVTTDLGYQVKLWDTRTGRLERTLSKHGWSTNFSPDGRWLAVGATDVGLLAVGSWEERQTLGGWGQFSPDSRMLVNETDSARALRLVEPDTGRELARLEDPNLDGAWNVTFTPDGSRLLVCTAQGVHVWDLRRIRAELAGRDLDWNAPPYPPAPAPSKPLTVELDLGDFHRLRPQHLVENYDRAVGAAPHLGVRWLLRAERAHLKARRYAEALRDLREAVRLEPNRARFCNDLARLYLMAPEPLRDGRAAVPLAERAVQLKAGQWAYVNTLGIAYYRTSRYADAVARLQESLAGGSGETDGANLYFLALCHYRQGDTARAEDCLRRARAWHAQQAGRLSEEEAEELRQFRSEAEAAVRLSKGPV